MKTIALGYIIIILVLITNAILFNRLIHLATLINVPIFCIKLTFPIVSISYLVLSFYLSLAEQRRAMVTLTSSYSASMYIAKTSPYSALLFLLFNNLLYRIALRFLMPTCSDRNNKGRITIVAGYSEKQMTQLLVYVSIGTVGKSKIVSQPFVWPCKLYNPCNSDI